MSEKTNDNLAQLVSGLSSIDASKRAEAANQLGQIEQSMDVVILALERTVATDPDESVQQAALEALDSPANSQLRQRRKPLNLNSRRLVLQEVYKWESEGLIHPAMSQLLKGRYTVSPVQPVKKKKRSAPVQQRSLGEILLSETTIRVALFLGAFFILAAAIILAAIVEVARLPILSVTTIGFLVAAGLLYRRLRLSSFIMAIVGTLLIAIDGGILIEQLGFDYQEALLSWSVITIILAIIYAVGTYLYESRLLSLLSYGFLITSVYLLAVEENIVFYGMQLLAVIFVTVGLVAASVLDRFRGWRLFWPLFRVSHFLLLATLAVAGTTILFQTAFDSPPTGMYALSVAGMCLITCFNYAYSARLLAAAEPDRYQSIKELFRILSLGALVPMPIFFVNTFEAADLTLMIVAWIWGLVLVAAAEFARDRLAAITRNYPPLLMIVSALLFMFASFEQWVQGYVAAVGFLVATAFVYFLLNARRFRWQMWSGSLLAAYLAYVAAFSLTGLASIRIFPGYIQLLPVTVLLGVAVLFIFRHRTDQARWLPPLTLSCTVATFTLIYTLTSGTYLETAITFLYYAGLCAIFAWLTGFGLAIFGSTVGITAALYFLMLEFEYPFAIWPYVALTGLYYLAGLVVSRLKWARIPALSNILRWSGLGLAFFVSLFIVEDSSFVSIAAVSVTAVMFTFEAWDRRNLWLGYPAALLYFAAYATLLNELDVTEPQYYSIFAALLGLVIHYLMLKINNWTPALLTGLAAQSILFTTTYAQMVATDEFHFFVLLFGQALVLLGYGVVLRSKSFVAGPIFYVVLGVFTVTVSVLSGLPVALMVGFTGLVLLLLGTMGLWFRRRIVSTAGSLSSQLAGWSW